MPGTVTLVVLVLLLIFAITVVVRTIRIVPQQTAVIIERLGSYSRTLDDGMHILVPFIDKPRATIDLREQVVTFPPQPVITSDNLVVSIDTVIYYTVTDAKSAVYEIANFIQGIEQLTVTTLRNVIGSLDLEETLTSRDQINGQLRGVLDEATGKWGIRVNRVELKAIDPPMSVQESMEKQMKGCWPTSTSRCCRSWPVVTPTRCGSSRRSSPMPCVASRRRSAATAAGEAVAVDLMRSGSSRPPRPRRPRRSSAPASSAIPKSSATLSRTDHAALARCSRRCAVAASPVIRRASRPRGR